MILDADVTVRCDFCDDKVAVVVQELTVDAVNRAVEKRGWLIVWGQHMCCDCRKATR